MPDGPLSVGEIKELDTVRTDSKLKDLCADLSRYSAFALDTEFMGERTYLPNLSLIQIATPDWIALIDPLSIESLDPLWELVADPSIEKVLHAAREDLRLTFANSGLPPANVFDTQVAAGLVGLPQYPVSYARLVEALTGVRLGKTETRSEWDRRPLTPEQIRYAKDDVRYLLDVRGKLGKVIERLGRQTWMDEEMSRFSDPSLYVADPDEVYLKIRGSRSGFGARQTGHLKALAAWRERQAAEHNIPPRSMLRDDILIELALRPPSHLNDFRRVKSFPIEESTTIGPHILAELQAVRRLSESELPPPLSGQTEQETPAQKAFADLAYALATIHCQSNHLASELVITRSSVLDIALGKSSAVLMSGWRKEVIGAFLDRLLQGDVDVRVHVENGVPQWVPVDADLPNPVPSLVGKGEG